MRFVLVLCLFISISKLMAQSPTWKLWASGLPTGVYPRMAIAPNHDIFYTLLGAGTKLGLIYKANTQDKIVSFTPLPQIPRPSSIQNNIVALGYNKLSEPIAGIYRTDASQPWLFRFNTQKLSWDTATSQTIPSLGGHCIATASNGTIYVGTRWAYIYKSTDDGKTFTAIDDTKLVKEAHPCYLPSFNGSIYNGAIFSIAVDANGRVYAGTETAGVIYSDDEGISWHPADLMACQTNDNTQKDTNSNMKALSISGNVAALGFTKDQNLVWSGVDMWSLGWKNRMGFASFNSKSVMQLNGLPDYLVQTGQQISKIVTTNSGQMFFHSGNSNGTNQSDVGIYTSRDGINWKLFNDGITGQNDGLSQGSLAVDGNKVFMATHDGMVWIYEDSIGISNNNEIYKTPSLSLYPNPVSHILHITLKSQNSSPEDLVITNAIGQIVKKISIQNKLEFDIDINDLQAGCYSISYLGSYKFVKI